MKEYSYAKIFFNYFFGIILAGLVCIIVFLVGWGILDWIQNTFFPY